MANLSMELEPAPAAQDLAKIFRNLIFMRGKSIHGGREFRAPCPEPNP
jgi:hypothetical protein